VRIVFFGTPAFAVPTLQRLLDSPHQVVLVVTQPDRPRGRGQRVQPEAVKRTATARGMPVIQPDRLKDPAVIAAIAARAPDLGVVAAYGRILPAPMLELPRLGLINVHASLLPRWRGAAPVHRAILAGDVQTGVTIMRVVSALDAGPMLDRIVVPIDDEVTSAELESRLAIVGGDLLGATVDRLDAGRVLETPQDETLVTYAPRLTREDGRIDWSRPARALHDQIRGLHPWPLVSVFWHGRRLLLRRSRPPGSAPASPGSRPGSIVAIERDAIVVAAGDGLLALTEVQLEGRPPVGAGDFVRGHRPAPGDRFEPGPAPAAP
jgi:methionyl-tRNA formyltransferase